MNQRIEHLKKAMQFAMSNRPKVGGFPFLPEVLNQAGVIKNQWSLPSCQSVYLMKDGAVVQQGKPLVEGLVDIPKFNQEALIKALRTDQAGQSTFPEFLVATWNAGVVSYEVDFSNRIVTYCGCAGETYVEEYPAVEVKL